MREMRLGIFLATFIFLIYHFWVTAQHLPTLGKFCPKVGNCHSEMHSILQTSSLYFDSSHILNSPFSGQTPQAPSFPSALHADHITWALPISILAWDLNMEMSNLEQQLCDWNFLPEIAIAEASSFPGEAEMELFQSSPGFTWYGWVGTVVAPLKLYHDMVCYHGILLSCVLSKPASLVLLDSLSYLYLIRKPFLLIWPRGSPIVANKKPVRHIHLVGLCRRKSHFDHIIQKCHMFTFPACHEARVKACELHSAYQRHPAGGGEGNRDRERFWWTVLEHQQRLGSSPSKRGTGPVALSTQQQCPHKSGSAVWVWYWPALCLFSKPRSPSSQRASLMCCHEIYFLLKWARVGTFHSSPIPKNLLLCFLEPPGTHHAL